MKKTLAVGLILALGAPGLWAAGGKEKAAGKGPIIVASKIVSEVARGYLESTGFLK